MQGVGPPEAVLRRRLVQGLGFRVQGLGFRVQGLGACDGSIQQAVLCAG